MRRIVIVLAVALAAPGLCDIGDSKCKRVEKKHVAPTDSETYSPGLLEKLERFKRKLLIEGIIEHEFKPIYKPLK